MTDVLHMIDEIWMWYETTMMNIYMNDEKEEYFPLKLFNYFDGVFVWEERHHHQPTTTTRIQWESISIHDRPLEINIASKNGALFENRARYIICAFCNFN